MAQFRQFGAISKVEDQPDGTIKVYGIASSGNQDSAGETVTSAAMKAALPDYERFPALREMHGLSAAGRTLDAVVDDDGITRIEAHVVDPTAILKVKTGVYSGFSIGGKVLARDPADRTIITKLKLNEISLVDRPCNPDAVIDLWKADGTPEDTEPMTTTPAPWAPANADVLAKAEAMAIAAGKPTRRNDYVVKAREALIAANAEAEAEIAKAVAAGHVADLEPEEAALEAVEKVGATDVPPEPVEAATDVLAALEASIEKAAAAATAPEPVSEADPVDPPQITAGLADFAKGLAVIAGADLSVDPLAKGLYTVGRLAEVMQSLVYIQSSTSWEAADEGDASKVPAMLAEQVRGLGATLIAMAQEEVAEVIASLAPDVDVVSPDVVDFAYAERVVDLVKADAELIAKVGARNSKADAKRLQVIHDHSVDLGAHCATPAPAAKAETPEDLAKVAAEAERLTEAMTKASASIETLLAANDDLRKRLEAIENTAAPPKGLVTTPAGLTSVSKVEDVAGPGAGDDGTISKASVAEYIASLTPEALGDLQVRFALKQPIRIGR